MAYKNKEDQAKAARKFYLKKKDKMIQRAKEHNNTQKVILREYVKNYLLSHPCVDCGESDIIVLEFDHITDDKKYNIANMYSGGHSIETVQREINKCEVRCANCHRRITHLRRNSRVSEVGIREGS